MAILRRQRYIDKIEKCFGKDLIVVLTGQRRVGKSYLLRLLKSDKESDESNHVIYIDKELREFDHIRNYQDLNDYVGRRLVDGKCNYVLIDEVQDVAEFERSVRSFCSEPGVEVVITGSNAKMLSSDLSTLIGGRYKNIYVQSLSYVEFLQFHQLADSDESLLKYLEFGGLPGLEKIGLALQDVREYQRDIYSTVLLKDVVLRNEIRNVVFLENLVKYIADNTGKLISTTNIAKFMNSTGEKVSSTSINAYISHLCEAYFIQKVHRYDIHGKKLFENNDKYYFEDNGVRNALSGVTREGDIEKVVENVVFQQLVRMGYEVNVGQLRAGEIDFVATKSDGNRVYVQVSYLILDDATRKREFGNLKNIKDNYPKYVISMTPYVTGNTDDGISHISLRSFLTNGFNS
ncbi:MAG: ATP-binding protein [Muribaculaceae bacterium]|nr:ATP-binding protein [Muribaculaceae bacterium]